jgi:hypothetical protein
MNWLKEHILKWLDPDRAALLSDRNYWRAMAKALPQRSIAPFVPIGMDAGVVEYEQADPGRF